MYIYIHTHTLYHYSLNIYIYFLTSVKNSLLHTYSFVDINISRPFLIVNTETGVIPIKYGEIYLVVSLRTI